MDLIYLKSKDALQNGRFPVERLWISNKRSEEHTSELQSQSNLVCRLLLEKKHQSVGGSQPPRGGALDGLLRLRSARFPFKAACESRRNSATTRAMQYGAR